jgi:hypothetical protein
MTSYSSPAQNRTIMAPRRGLFDTAHHFCEAFSNNDSDTIFSHFSTKHEVSAIEYGEQALAPFLGRTFVGISQIKDYFALISSLLSVKHVKFSEYVVDPEAMKVSVKGRGTFTWLDTNQSWDETFTYTLDFDEDSKIVRYQVWADSGAAYLARIGKLDQVKERGKLPQRRDVHHLSSASLGE